MNWLIKLLFAVIGELLTGAVKLLADLINNIFSVMYNINVELGFDKLNLYTGTIAFSFVAAMVLKQCFEVYVLQTEGDPDADPLEMITRIFVTIATIVAGPQLIPYGVKMAGQFTDEAISKIIPEKKSLSDLAYSIIKKIIAGATIQMFIFLIFTLVTIIALFIFIFSAGKRAAELILFGIMMPLVALDLLSTNKERWNAFFTELMLTIFGYCVQLISFNIFLMLYAKVAAELSLEYMIASLCWLIIVLSAPKWLQKFIYTSGAGNTAKGGLRTTSSMVTNLVMRKIV